MPITPFGPGVERVDNDSIELSVRVSRGNGTWIELNDRAILRIAEGSFSDEAASMRRITVTNPFLEGEETVQALRGNIIRPLNVWIQGKDHYEMASTKELLVSCFTQLRFQVVRTIENVSETMDCSASDYGVSSDRPFLHARMCQLKVQLVTHPVTALVEEL